MASGDDICSSIDYTTREKWLTAGVDLDRAEKVTTHIQGRKETHLCKLLRAESHFLPQLGLDPVFIHPPDESKNVSLYEAQNK